MAAADGPALDSGSAVCTALQNRPAAAWRCFERTILEQRARRGECLSPAAGCCASCAVSMMVAYAVSTADPFHIADPISCQIQALRTVPLALASCELLAESARYLLCRLRCAVAPTFLQRRRHSSAWSTCRLHLFVCKAAVSREHARHKAGRMPRPCLPPQFIWFVAALMLLSCR